MTRTFKPGDRVAVGRGGPRAIILAIEKDGRACIELDFGDWAIVEPKFLIPLRKKRKAAREWTLYEYGESVGKLICSEAVMQFSGHWYQGAPIRVREVTKK